MYYNPQTKETVSEDALKRLLHASFPQNEEEVNGWHLLCSDPMPAVQDGQSIVQDEIVFRNGKYFQTYKTIGIPKPSRTQMSLEDRIGAPESGLMEIAQILSERII